ncbi:MAG: hypothetical protein U9N86_10365 [Bacteroidota bacterium]|nr:hypothetical protein [Bacteroidota bacterium]
MGIETKDALAVKELFVQKIRKDGTALLNISTPYFSGASNTFNDGANLVMGTSTGTKIGTGTTQKLGFWNTTPAVQPTAVADATDNASAILRLNELLARLRTIGIIAT